MKVCSILSVVWSQKHFFIFQSLLHTVRYGMVHLIIFCQSLMRAHLDYSGIFCSQPVHAGASLEIMGGVFFPLAIDLSFSNFQ